VITSPNGDVDHVAEENYGQCGWVYPPNGMQQRRWTCPDCVQGEGVTLRYTPLTTLPAEGYLVADIYSCGQPRYIGMWVRDSLGNVCRAFTTACNEGMSPRNEWEQIYVDLSRCSLVDVVSVEFITEDLFDWQVVYVGDVRPEASKPTCGPETTPCIAMPWGYTCTPTTTMSPTATGTPCMVDGNTCTFTETPTWYETWTPTMTPTWTHTTTPTPWPIRVFPNPMDFGKRPPDANFCPPGMGESGCIKFIGLPRGSSLTIYSLSLKLVRTFTAAEVAAFGVPPAIRGGSGDTQTAWVAWAGDNDDRNPVSAGLYFYVVETPTGERIVGRLAIARANRP
jgi:hypothetical protein